MTWESDLAFCRLGSHKALAQSFAKWQSVISAPNLDRKLASTATLTPAGMVIAGTIFFIIIILKIGYSPIIHIFTQVLTLALVPNMTLSNSNLKWLLDL